MNVNKREDFEITARVAGYSVWLQLETDSSGWQTSSCIISGKSNGKEYSSSLACAEATGMLDDELEISPKCLEMISAWAEKNGY